jgi:hypothetical protein
LGELSKFIEGVYYVLPLLLAPDFGDPPIAARVDGTISGVPFRGELATWRMDFTNTTQERQQDLVRVAWRRLALIRVEERRLVAALHYFHVATRLLRTSASPGEFLSEALLNFSKILEVLFQDSWDTARRELAALGFTEDEIERDFVSVMVLRSKIDIAHVSLALFTPWQLTILHCYADRAETRFRRLLQILLARLDAGKLALPHHELHGADENTVALLRRLEHQLESLGDRP